MITARAAARLSKLKQQPGSDILVAGSRTLVQTLMQHDLVDEYRLMVFPVVLGSGMRLFTDESERTALRLADTKTVGEGVLILIYEPARKEADA